MGGLIDLPTSTDYVPWLDHSIPADKRDFSRPRESFNMSTVPTNDINYVAEPDVNDGWLGDAWKAVKEFVGIGPAEEEVEVKKDIEEAKKSIDDIEKEQKAKIDSKSNHLILAFQVFFSKSHPVIGKLYDGPKDGVMNDALKTAAQTAESKIAGLTTPDVRGVIWTGNGFGTSPADISSAIDVIIKHEGKKATFLNRKERILAFSSFISK